MILLAELRWFIIRRYTEFFMRRAVAREQSIEQAEELAAANETDIIYLNRRGFSREP